MIAAQRETGPAISFGASLLSFHSLIFEVFLKSKYAIFFGISQNNVFRNVLNLSSLIF